MESTSTSTFDKYKLGKTLWKALAPTLGVVAYAGSTEAATINVTDFNSPSSGKCSLTQAIQAATTNTAVGGKGGCVAGSSSKSDTIVLPAGTFQDYSAPLHVPGTGGPLVIDGAGPNSTVIIGRNYGYPSPNPINADVCQYPAAIFTGGSNLEIKDLKLRSNNSGTGHMGICQYAGSLTLTNVELGDGSQQTWFNRGGLWSFPNSPSTPTRNITINSSYIFFNFSPLTGGGIAIHGNANATINWTLIYDNISRESGGGIAWWADGTLTVANSQLHRNWAEYSYGGGMAINPASFSSVVNINGTQFVQNVSDYYGGAIWVGNMFGPNNLRIGASPENISWFDNNTGTNPLAEFPLTYDPAQQTFNAEETWAYDAIWCTGGSEIDQLQSAPWTSHTPRLRGDGTCTFPF